MSSKYEMQLVRTVGGSLLSWVLFLRKGQLLCKIVKPVEHLKVLKNSLKNGPVFEIGIWKF